MPSQTQSVKFISKYFCFILISEFSHFYKRRMSEEERVWNNEQWKRKRKREISIMSLWYRYILLKNNICIEVALSSLINYWPLFILDHFLCFQIVTFGWENYNKYGNNKDRIFIHFGKMFSQRGHSTISLWKMLENWKINI